MKFGLQINSFTWPGGAAAIGPTLARVARTADDVGFDSIWVMDLFFQIRGLGPPEAPMLEARGLSSLLPDTILLPRTYPSSYNATRPSHSC